MATDDPPSCQGKQYLMSHNAEDAPCEPGISADRPDHPSGAELVPQGERDSSPREQHVLRAVDTSHAAGPLRSWRDSRRPPADRTHQGETA